MNAKYITLTSILCFGFFFSNLQAQNQALARVFFKGDFGYINRQGELVIEDQYNEALDFSDGLAAVEYKGDWGYINPQGDWAIEPKYKNAGSFDSGVAMVETKDGDKYINKSGEVLDIAKGEDLYEFHFGAAFFRNGDNVGMINTKGEVILPAEYKKITVFINGYARILKHDGNWGIVDSKGNIVVEPAYIDIGNFISHAAWARNADESLVIVTEKGVYPTDAIKIKSFRPGAELATAQKNEKYGLMNKQGEWVLEPQYEDMQEYSNGLAAAFDGENWGFVDKTGDWVIRPKYGDAVYFTDDGLAAVEVDGEDWGFINKDGEMVIEPKYLIYVDNSQNQVTGMGILGNMAVDAVVDAASNKLETVGFINGIARIELKDYGYIDMEGNLLGEDKYDKVYPFVSVVQ